MTVYACCDDKRRGLLATKPAFNGIDWLEVEDLDAPTPALRQKVLRVGFVNDPAPPGLGIPNVRITGGVRITGIKVVNVVYDGQVLTVSLDRYGDFSPYVFALVSPDGSPLAQLDPVLSQISFGFKVECPTDIDCATCDPCAPDSPAPPVIDYLAKDYDTFRRLMLDRMALTAPNWTERSAADFINIMVEVLAYAADRLSYQQDAVSTEAYLGTARRRISVRRHARLVDYDMHDGSSARTVVVLLVPKSTNGKVLPGPQQSQQGGQPPWPGTLFLPRLRDGTIIPVEDRDAVLSSQPVAFEAMHDLTLYFALNELHFYTWGNERCCLAKGATRATLVAPDTSLGPPPDLTGRLLVFQEKVGPLTGAVGDADPSHRHVVRVVSMSPAFGAPAVTDPLTTQSIVDIVWGDEDALPFPLCISSVADPAHGSVTLENVSVAYGNVVLADHGLTQPAEDLGIVPSPQLTLVPAPGCDPCVVPDAPAVPVRFRPRLAKGPLTQVGQTELVAQFEGEEEAGFVPFDRHGSAASALSWPTSSCLPAIQLFGDAGNGPAPWSVRGDLLESESTASDFVVETDSDLVAQLRFGDDEYGMRPAAETQFTAYYRVGCGLSGNIGHDALAHVVAPPSGAPANMAVPADIDQIFNPIAAAGGVDPETISSVRLAAPAAFRVQERAVTAADYAEVTLRDPDVAQAAASFRWTGSWHTVFDAVARPMALAADETFTDGVTAWLERYRVVGHDLQVLPPVFVSLRIDIAVCVAAGYYRSDILVVLRQLLGNGGLPGGGQGFFNRSQRRFGETLYLSRLYALVQSVTGVTEVEISRFERLYQPGSYGLDAWELTFGPAEIAVCDNDPNFPEHGVLNLVVRGGQ